MSARRTGERVNTRERGRGKAVPLDAVPSAAVGGKAAKKKEKKEKKEKKKKGNAKSKKNARQSACIELALLGSGGGEVVALDSAALLSKTNW